MYTIYIFRKSVKQSTNDILKQALIKVKISKSYANFIGDMFKGLSTSNKSMCEITVDLRVR